MFFALRIKAFVHLWRIIRGRMLLAKTQLFLRTGAMREDDIGMTCQSVGGSDMDLWGLGRY